MTAADTPMKLTFLGTRGGIKRRSRRHWRHSALLVEQAGTRVMIDCGADWLGRIRKIAPAAILLTHAHPEHAAGLAKGAPCAIHALPETVGLLHRYPIEDRRTMPARSVTEGLQLTAVRAHYCPSTLSEIPASLLAVPSHPFQSDARSLQLIQHVTFKVLH